jgi:hypothetical protein
MKPNAEISRVLPATERGPRPGDFPVGSPESRAAARALLEKIESDERIFRIIICSDHARPRVGGPGVPGPDGRIVEIVHLPHSWNPEQWREFLDDEPPERQRLWKRCFSQCPRRNPFAMEKTASSGTTPSAP